MRDDHPECGPGARVQPEADALPAERHQPRHRRRHDLHRANHLQNAPGSGGTLDPADHKWAPCLGRHQACDREKDPRAGQGYAQLPVGHTRPVETVDLGEFKEGGAAMAMHNRLESTEGFARVWFNDALRRECPLFASTKNTILQACEG